MYHKNIPVFGEGAQQPNKPALRTTRRWSWMASGWLTTTDLGQDGGGTTCMTLGCPDDFVAVRLGFANISSQAWRLTSVIARPSDHFNDYITPTGEASWTSFGCSSGCGEDTVAVVNQKSSNDIEVRGVADTALGRAAELSWTWTDWAPIRSLAPDPQHGMRVLMLRAFIPPNQTVTFANGQFRSFTGNPITNRGHDMLIGGLKFNIDMVSDPNGRPAGTTQTWIDNQLGPGTAFPIVQFMTRRPGVSGIVTGDSHAQGTSTTEQFSSFSLGLAGFLLAKSGNRLPFGMVNCALGGLTSESFFARLRILLDEVNPSYAVLPGWTYNDKNNGVNADKIAMDIFLARLMHMIDTCQQKGILPIVLTPFPRDEQSMTSVQMGPWRDLRQTLLDLRTPGMVVIDTTSILAREENGIFDGTYLSSMSSDGMHPNDEGHTAVAAALVNIIKSHL